MNALVGTLPRNVLSRGLLPRTLEELRAFVGLTAKTAKPPIETTIADLFTRIAQITDSLFVSALEKRTGPEFRATATAEFNNYAHILRAKAHLLRVVLPNDNDRTERLIHQSLSELEADFRDQGVQRFGTAVNDQAVFTVWILRKTTDHIWKLLEPEAVNKTMTDEQKTALEELSSEFALYSAWAQFHLGCLNAAVRLDKAIYPDVLPEIVNGLRAMVNANAFSRQIVEIWIPSDDAALTPYRWDAEDEELMQSSMRDMESDEL